MPALAFLMFLTGVVLGVVMTLSVSGQLSKERQTPQIEGAILCDCGHSAVYHNSAVCTKGICSCKIGRKEVLQLFSERKNNNAPISPIPPIQDI